MKESLALIGAVLLAMLPRIAAAREIDTYHGHCQALILANQFNDTSKCHGIMTIQGYDNGIISMSFLLDDEGGTGEIVFEGFEKEKQPGRTAYAMLPIHRLLLTNGRPCKSKDALMCCNQAMKAAKTVAVPSGVCSINQNHAPPYHHLIICTVGPDNSFVAVFESNGQPPEKGPWP
jgi:hypothetical protein